MQSIADMKVQGLSIAGIRVDALQRDELSAIIERARGSKERVLILNHNAHSLYLYLNDPVFASAYQAASWVYVDGMPVIWLAQLAGLQVKPGNRITFLDCFYEILHDAVRYRWRVFYLGSSEQVLTEGLALLRKQHPGLTIEGAHGFFEKEGSENEQMIARVNAFKPDVLFVGMGMPIQERWIRENLASLEVTSILTSGATLDYVTGHSYRPPAWAGPLGLYGILRLCHDPRRLWRRYLLEPLFLLFNLIPSLIRQRLTKDREDALSVVSRSA